MCIRDREGPPRRVARRRRAGVASLRRRHARHALLVAERLRRLRRLHADDAAEQDDARDARDEGVVLGRPLPPAPHAALACFLWAGQPAALLVRRVC